MRVSDAALRAGAGLRLAPAARAAARRSASSPTPSSPPTSTRRRAAANRRARSAQRLGGEKADAAAAVARKRDELDRALTLAADTVVCVGRRILPKGEIADEAEDCLRLLSGRAHRVYTGARAGDARRAPTRTRLVETRVRFKRLSRDEIDAYLASGEWRGKAGGYAIQGFAGAFVVRLIGSYTNVVGLPLAETAALLAGEGFPAARRLAAGVSERSRAAPKPCPICGKPRVAEYAPFCSRRCADIDLGRWLKGAM